MLNRKLEDSHRREMDLQAQMDQLAFDKEMLERSMSTNDRTKDAMSRKEEELYREIQQLQE